MTTTYLSLAQTTARIAQRLLSTDQARLAWAGLAEADQLVCMERAQAAIDDCHWKGSVYDIYQETMWPRVVEYTGGTGGTRLGGTQFATTASGNPPLALVDADTIDTDCLVPSIPRAVKDAFAVQCAAEALRGAGLDVGGHVEEAARLGVVSQGVGGQTETINLAVASSPFARLCPDAQRRMVHLRMTTAQMV